MDGGGFDAVIGNPPYIRMEEFKELKGYLKEKYQCHDERSDIYTYFIEQGHKILKWGGYFGMIVSNKFLRANYGKRLREFLQQNTSVDHVVDFAGLPVFKGATVRTIVLLTRRQEQIRELSYSPPFPVEVFISVESGTLSVDKAVKNFTFSVSKSNLENDVWSFTPPDVRKLLDRLIDVNIPLRAYCKDLICMGVKSGLTKAFVVNE